MLQGIQGPFQVDTLNWQSCPDPAGFKGMKNGEVKNHEFFQTVLKS